MAIGSDNEGMKPPQVEGKEESAGIPAAGQLEGSAFNPLGNPGIKHWQASFISRPGLEDRGNIFFAAVEMTRMPMLVTDPNQADNPVVFVNGAFLDLTGYEEKQVLGRNCRFLQGEQTDRHTVAEVRMAVQEQRAVAVDILNYKADGTPFWNALFIGPIFDREGKLLYFFASQLDITRRRVSEQAYLQAQKMEAVGQLTAGLAHDFNNLLQVVTGNLEVAQESLDDKENARTAIEFAQQAANKAGQLTQQLLTFARKQNLAPRRVNLNALVVEFSEMLIRTLGDKVDLHLDLKPGLPSCTLDATHMEMALLNVLINARDAMPQGGKVTVATSVLADADRIASHQLQAGTYVTLCVIDEGQGMPADVVRRATEPFFTTKMPGTGLGLAMVHGFVQQSHGRLEIESEIGKGTSIRMIFPIAERPAFEAAAAAKLTKGEPGRSWTPESIIGKKTILVVDDSQDVLVLAESYLRSIGYRVLAAKSGEEALEMIERYGGIDLLFTDVIMPGGMNGLKLAEKVRLRQPGVAVLLSTGYMEELPRYGALAASLDIMTKPYRQTELAERVRIALEKVKDQAKPLSSKFYHEG